MGLSRIIPRSIIGSDSKLGLGVLQIHFTEIPDEGLQCIVDDVSWFPDQEVVRRGAPDAVVHLRRNGERVLVDGTLTVSLVFNCDRCLEEFVSPQQIAFQLVLEPEDGETVSGAQLETEYDYDPGKIEVLPFDGQLIDLGDLLYQQIILVVPQKNLCRADCRGLCEHCGVNLNNEQCSCLMEKVESPFSSLRQLLKGDK